MRRGREKDSQTRPDNDADVKHFGRGVEEKTLSCIPCCASSGAIAEHCSSNNVKMQGVRRMAYNDPNPPPICSTERLIARRVPGDRRIVMRWWFL
jgi:hypothetical protein